MRSLLLSPWDRSPRTTIALILAVVAGCAAVGIVASRAGAPRPPVLAHPRTEAQNVDSALGVVNGPGPGFRVLFIGNSLTYMNALPEMVVEMEAGKAHPAERIVPIMYAPGGSTLARDVQDAQLRRLVWDGRWNAVVLQDHSLFPSDTTRLLDYSMPAVTYLRTLITRDGRRDPATFGFETWGLRYGAGAFDSYRAMQQRLRTGYSLLSVLQGLRYTPIGDAWARALRARPTLPLWMADGNHGTVTGSYLAAAVLDDEFDLPRDAGRPIPLADGYTAGLNPGLALWLRRIAAETVSHDGGARFSAAYLERIGRYEARLERQAYQSAAQAQQGR